VEEKKNTIYTFILEYKNLSKLSFESSLELRH